MKGFRKLIIFGVMLFTLILIIDTIDAGRKITKKKELESGKSYNQEDPKYSNKIKQNESVKQNKMNNIGTQRTEKLGEQNQYKNKGSKFQSKKYDVRKNFKFANKDENDKTSKHFQKLKKSKDLKKPQYQNSENGDKIFKNLKKTSQKKLIQENENIENILREELNRFKSEDIDSVEDSAGGNAKKRKYKLVEVVLQEDGQEEEEQANEAAAELGLEEFEETQNPTPYKNKKIVKRSNNLEEDQHEEPTEDYYFNNTEETVESEVNEETTSEPDFASNYENPETEDNRCKRSPQDSQRKGPKKLTLYVIEEEVNGEIRKRIQPEEDGVSMCEVADLLRETYARYMPEE